MISLGFIRIGSRQTCLFSSARRCFTIALLDKPAIKPYFHTISRSYFFPNAPTTRLTSQIARVSRRLSSTQRIPSDITIANVELPDPDATPDKLEHITCAYFDREGHFVKDQKSLTKAEIAQQFELRHRDLRDIDLRSESVARILIRPKTILLQFFQICMIVQADEALLISPRHEDDGGAADENHKLTFYHKFESRMSGTLAETPGLPVLPYELRAVEAALIAVVSKLRAELVDVSREAQDVAQQLNLTSGLAAIGLEEVFESTRRLGQIEQKARVVRDTLRELLDTDEDLAGMYLTDNLAGRAHAVSDHQEAEYMLEAYHKATDSLVGSTQAIIDGLRKKENTFRSALAVQRNQIMFLEARIAINTLGLAAGTLVAGLFGMNLVNYFEEHPQGFVMVTGGCLALSLVFSVYGMRSMWRIQSLRGLQKMSSSSRRKSPK